MSKNNDYDYRCIIPDVPINAKPIGYFLSINKPFIIVEYVSHFAMESFKVRDLIYFGGYNLHSIMVCDKDFRKEVENLELVHELNGEKVYEFNDFKYHYDNYRLKNKIKMGVF